MHTWVSYNSLLASSFINPATVVCVDDEALGLWDNDLLREPQFPRFLLLDCNSARSSNRIFFQGFVSGV